MVSLGARGDSWALIRSSCPSLGRNQGRGAERLAAGPPRHRRDPRNLPAASMAHELSQTAPHGIDGVEAVLISTQPDLDLVEHRAPRTPLVGELLLALDVLHDELAVGIIFIHSVELLLPARSMSLASRPNSLKFRRETSSDGHESRRWREGTSGRRERASCTCRRRRPSPVCGPRIRRGAGCPRNYPNTEHRGCP